MAGMLGNVIAMVRVEAGTLRPDTEWQSMEEIIGVALRRVDGALEGREVVTVVPTDLPLVAVDGLLIEHVIVNLLDNATKYSAAQSPIEVRVSVTHDEMEVCVADRGVGLTPGEEERVFDKYYSRARATGQAGAGIGLTICRAVVAAHGGRIRSRRRAEGGTAFCFTIPRRTSPPAVMPEPVDA
jgi:two-component system sensor histidine kinase KdpD